MFVKLTQDTTGSDYYVNEDHIVAVSRESSSTDINGQRVFLTRLKLVTGGEVFVRETLVEVSGKLSVKP